MRNKDRLVRQVSWCLVISMLLFLGNEGMAQAQQSQAPISEQSGATAENKQPSTDAASPVAAANETAANYPDAPVAQNNQNPPAPQGAQSSSTQAPADDQNKDARPLGTAAAPYTRPSGVTGSRPAGAVIAPGKQHRAHIILISVALVAGAAIAVGTVAALSSGSAARP
jgi:cytoskeletal protein RodZ